MTYELAHNSWGKEELEAIQKVIDSDRLTMGPFTEQFELFESYCAFLFNCFVELSIYDFYYVLEYINNCVYFGDIDT